MAEKMYKGTLFSDRVETGRCGVRIKATDTGLEIHTPDGRVFKVAYHSLKVDRKESTGKMFRIIPLDQSFILLSLEMSLLKKMQKFGLIEATVNN